VGFLERSAVLGTGVEALREPTAFFRRRDPSLRSALGVVLAAAAVRLLAVLPLFWLFRYLVRPSAWVDIVGLSLVFMAGYALVRWALLAGVVYGTARALGGDRRFRDLLAYLGWSHLPNLVGAGLVLLVTVGVAVTLPAPTTEAEASRFAFDLSRRPMLTLSAASGMVEARTGVSLDQVQVGIGALQLVWGATMWVAAARVGCDLDDRRALVAVALPVVVAGLVVFVPQVDFGISV